MHELLRVLKLIPVQIRILGTILLLLPVAFLIARTMGLGSKVASLAVLGLLIVLIVVWGFNSLLKLVDKKRAKDFEAGLGATVSKEEVREAVGELAEQWQYAVGQLRASGLSIYDLPWYLLFGEPQSGKSTTLRNSGLEFPIGQEALSGAGGTRNCDWWFTNEAVILDTAGRFSFQEDTAPDRHEWEAFLKLLRRHRKSCPINGAIVVIPATSLCEDPPDERERKAKNIRHKLLELQRQLEIRFPIFILVTKADRILGFTEFFSRLEPAQQRQLFGWSNSDSFDQPWDPHGFTGIFAEIVRRIHKLRLLLMREVDDSSQLDKLFVFPEELAAVSEPLAGYLQTIFAASRFEEPFILRGFYLTSGVQQGQPVARACRDLLRVQVGDPRGVLENLESAFRESRAFFIRDFYEKKLFREQGLIARTRQAIEKDRTYGLVFRGLIVAAVLAAFLLLLPAALNLYADLRPVNEEVEKATGCLESREPCELGESYDLIYRIERRKRALSESRWTMRALLHGGTRNEITEELLPAVQAGLFRRHLLVPLLTSFEARADPLLWQTEGADYPTFFDAFQQLLRFGRYHLAEAGDREALRAALSIEPLLRFCRGASGVDPSPAGKEIDAWLAGDFDLAEAEEIFQSMLGSGSFDVADVGRLREPQGAHRTFQAYWRIANLARWDHDLLQHLESWVELYDGIARLEATGTSARGTLDAFADLTRRFGQNWDDGAAHMSLAGAGAGAGDTAAAPAGDLPAAARRLVASVATSAPQAWEEGCRADYAVLRELSQRLVSESAIAEHCGTIAGDWSELQQKRRRYAYLYREEEADGVREIAWSEAAAKVKEPLITLGDLAREERERAEIARFEELLDRLPGDRERLAEIRTFYEAQQAKVFAPVDLLDPLKEPDLRAALPDLGLDLGWHKARELASLALALRTLPPIGRYFGDRLPRGGYTIDFARTAVPPANAFLSWVSRTLGPALGYREVAEQRRRVDEAVYGYLESYVDRTAAQVRPPGGGFVYPRSAAGAGRWRDFVGAIRSWRPIASGGSAALPADGLTLMAMEDFVRDNDGLEPLVRELRSGLAPLSAGPRRVPGALVQAADDFKRCVEGLDDDPQQAWRQLALEADGASLAAFFVFSSNPLRGDYQARRMRDSVTANGARLLVAAVAPEFERRFAELWSRIERCCAGRYPFLGEGALGAARASYERGYQAGAGDQVWGRRIQDRGRGAVTDVLQLDTAGPDDLDGLFFGDGGLDDLYRDFALEPVLGREDSRIDFVGARKERLRALRLWQRFLYGESEGDGFSSMLRERSFTIQLLRSTGAAGRPFLGKRVSRVDLFGSQSIRTADAGRHPVREVPVRIDPRELRINAVNEDRDGWSGHLEIRGGALKLFYFVQLAEERRSDRVYRLRVLVPDYEQPNQRPEGIFELAFDRPLPGVVADR